MVIVRLNGRLNGRLNEKLKCEAGMLCQMVRLNKCESE